jgi:hypothetical protein
VKTPFRGREFMAVKKHKNKRDAHKYIRPLAPSQREAITGGEHHD